MALMLSFGIILCPRDAWPHAPHAPQPGPVFKSEASLELLFGEQGDVVSAHDLQETGAARLCHVVANKHNDLIVWVE